MLGIDLKYSLREDLHKNTYTVEMRVNVARKRGRGLLTQKPFQQRRRIAVMRHTLDGGQRFRINSYVLAGRHVNAVELQAWPLRCG